MISSQPDLPSISNSLENAHPRDILRWALLQYRDKLTMATAFGPEGCCMLEMLAGLRDEIGLVPDIFNLDTGYQFPQTLALRDKLQQKYGLNIRLVRPEESVAELEQRHQGPLYKRDPEQCCYLRKIVPLQNAVQGFEAWITAIRRDQTPERATQPIVGPDGRFPLIKINPLANWTSAQVWEYIKERGIPTNLLHGQGYTSIGCWPCTRPVRRGEDERAGRWAGQDKRECGLHLAVAAA